MGHTDLRVGCIVVEERGNPGTQQSLSLGRSVWRRFSVDVVYVGGRISQAHTELSGGQFVTFPQAEPARPPLVEKQIIRALRDRSLRPERGVNGVITASATIVAAGPTDSIRSQHDAEIDIMIIQDVSCNGVHGMPVRMRLERCLPTPEGCYDVNEMVRLDCNQVSSSEAACPPHHSP